MVGTCGVAITTILTGVPDPGMQVVGSFVVLVWLVTMVRTDQTGVSKLGA